MSDFVSWSNYDNWPLESVVWRVHPGNLALDAVVALLVVGALGWATESWIRSRGGLLRFRVIDFLAATTFSSLILGWHVHHVHWKDVERQVVENVQQGKPRQERGLTSYQRYCGPDWLRRLVGDDSYLPQCSHVYRVDISSSASSLEEMDRIVQLPFVEEFAFHGPFPKSALRSLEKCSQLTALFVDMYDPSGSNDQAYRANRNDELIGPADLDEVMLGPLRQLTLRGHVFLADDIERALEAYHIEQLDLYNVSVTVDELDSMRERFAETRIYINWPSPRQPPPGQNALVRRMKDRRRCDLGLIAACNSGQ
ncbi:MAG: hypothetical protein R3C10_16390 [Pirellulales bacterium]